MHVNVYACNRVRMKSVIQAGLKGRYEGKVRRADLKERFRGKVRREGLKERFGGNV